MLSQRNRGYTEFKAVRHERDGNSPREEKGLEMGLQGERMDLQPGHRKGRPVGSPWGCMRSGVFEKVELVFYHFPFQSPQIRNVGHSSFSLGENGNIRKIEKGPGHQEWGQGDRNPAFQKLEKGDQQRVDAIDRWWNIRYLHYDS